MGAKLTNLQSRIFDVILRSGIDGLSRADIIAVVFEKDDAYFPKLRNTLKQHIHHINDSISDAGYRIRSFGFVARIGQAGFYRLEKKRERTK